MSRSPSITQKASLQTERKDAIPGPSLPAMATALGASELHRFTKLSREVHRKTGFPTFTAEPLSEEKQMYDVLDHMPYRKELRAKVGPGFELLPQHQQELVLRLRPNEDDEPPSQLELYAAKEHVAEILNHFNERLLSKDTVREELTKWTGEFPKETSDLEKDALVRYRDIESDNLEDTTRQGNVESVRIGLSTGFERLTQFGSHLHRTILTAQRMQPYRGNVELFTQRGYRKRDVSTTTAVIIPCDGDSKSALIPEGCKALPCELFDLDDESDDEDSSVDGDGGAQGDQNQGVPLATSGSLSASGPPHAVAGGAASHGAMDAIGRLQKILLRKSDMLVQSLAKREAVSLKSAYRIAELKTLLALRDRQLSEAAEEAKSVLMDSMGVTIPWADTSEESAAAFLRANMDAILTDLRHTIRKERHALEIQAKLAEAQQKAKEARRKQLNALKVARGLEVSPDDALQDMELTTENERILHAKCTNLQQAVDHLSLQLSASEAVVSERTATITGLKTDNAILKTECDVKQAQIHDLQGRIEYLSEMVDINDQKANALEAKLVVATEFGRSEETISKIRKQFQAAMALQQREAADLRQKLDKLKEENTNLELQLQQSQSQLGSFENFTNRYAAKRQSGASSSSGGGGPPGAALDDVSQRMALELLGLAGWVGQTMRQLRTCIKETIGSAMREKAFTLSVQILNAAVKAISNVEDDLVLKEGALAKSHLKQLRAELKEAQGQGAVKDPADEVIAKLNASIASMIADQKKKETMWNDKLTAFREELHARQGCVNALTELQHQLFQSLTAMAKNKNSDEIAGMAFDKVGLVQTSKDPDVEDAWRLAKQSWMAFKHRLLSNNDNEGTIGSNLRIKLDQVLGTQEKRLYNEATAVVRKFSDAVFYGLLQPLTELCQEFQDDPQMRVTVRKIDIRLKEYKALTKDLGRFTFWKGLHDSKDKAEREKLLMQISHCSEQFEKLSTYWLGKFEKIPHHEREQSKEAKRLSEIKELRVRIVKRLDSKIEHWRAHIAHRLALQWDRFAKLQAQREAEVRAIAACFSLLVGNGVHGLILNQYSHAMAATNPIPQSPKLGQGHSDMRKNSNSMLGHSFGSLSSAADLDGTNSLIPQVQSRTLAELESRLGKELEEKEILRTEIAELKMMLGEKDGAPGSLGEHLGASPSKSRRPSLGDSQVLTLIPPAGMGGSLRPSRSPAVSWLDEGRSGSETPPTAGAGIVIEKPTASSSKPMGAGASKLLKKLTEERDELQRRGQKLADGIAESLGLMKDSVLFDEHGPDLLVHSVQAHLSDLQRKVEKLQAAGGSGDSPSALSEAKSPRQRQPPLASTYFSKITPRIDTGTMTEMVGKLQSPARKPTSTPSSTPLANKVATPTRQSSLSRIKALPVSPSPARESAFTSSLDSQAENTANDLKQNTKEIDGRNTDLLLTTSDAGSVPQENVRADEDGTDREEQATQTLGRTMPNPFALAVSVTQRSKSSQTDNALLTDLLTDLVHVLQSDLDGFNRLPPTARLMPVPACDPTPVDPIALAQRGAKLAEAVQQYSQHSQSPLAQRSYPAPAAMVKPRSAIGTLSRAGGFNKELAKSSPTPLQVSSGNVPSSPVEALNRPQVSAPSIVSIPNTFTPYPTVAGHFQPDEEVQLYKTNRRQQGASNGRDPVEIQQAVAVDRSLTSTSPAKAVPSPSFSSHRHPGLKPKPKQAN